MIFPVWQKGFESFCFILHDPTLKRFPTHADICCRCAYAYLSCWQTLCAAILSGVGRQGAAAGIALAADGVQLVLTCLLVSGRGMQGYAFAFTLSAVLGAAQSTGRAWASTLSPGR